MQRGFSLITSIFLLVVVASLGALMMTFFTAQQQSSAIDSLGSRAYQAARLGIEWGAFQITQSGVVSPAGFAGGCQNPGGTTSSVPVTGTPLSLFTVGVSCSATSSVEGTTETWVYNMTAIASGVDGATPGSADYVEREIQAGVWSQGVSQVVIWK